LWCILHSIENTTSAQQHTQQQILENKNGNIGEPFPSCVHKLYNPDSEHTELNIEVAFGRRHIFSYLIQKIPYLVHYKASIWPSTYAATIFILKSSGQPIQPRPQPKKPIIYDSVWHLWVKIFRTKNPPAFFLSSRPEKCSGIIHPLSEYILDTPTFNNAPKHQANPPIWT
jgi:hypothetical protein